MQVIYSKDHGGNYPIDKSAKLFEWCRRTPVTENSTMNCCFISKIFICERYLTNMLDMYELFHIKLEQKWIQWSLQVNLINYLENYYPFV